MRRWLQCVRVFSCSAAARVTSALLVWLKRADSFVGLRKDGWRIKQKKTCFLSLPLASIWYRSLPGNIRAAEHAGSRLTEMVPPSTCLYSGCQTRLWTMCLYKLSAGICSQSGLGSSKCKRLSENHLGALSSFFKICLALQKKKRKVWFLCLCSTRKYLIIRNLFRLNLGKRCVSPESNAGQPTETPSWWIPLLSASCEWICTKLTGDQRHPRTSRTKRCLRILFLWVQGCRTPLLALVFSTHPCIFTVEKGPTHSAHLQNIL